MKYLMYLMLACVLIAGTARADFYVEGGLSAFMTRGNTYTATAVYKYHLDALGNPVMDSFVDNQQFVINTNDRTTTHNPYGDLRIGYDWSFKKLTFDIELTHQSSIVAGDRGDDSVRIGVKWYPFR